MYRLFNNIEYRYNAAPHEKKMTKYDWNPFSFFYKLYKLGPDVQKKFFRKQEILEDLKIQYANEEGIF